jgi:DnaJ-domain-containing protein 1
MDGSWLCAEEGAFRFSPISEGQAGSAQPQSGSNPWYVVLEVQPDADPREIRSAYLAAISAYHPDRVSGLGAKLTQLAGRESQAINAAYAEARRERGF